MKTARLTACFVFFALVAVSSGPVRTILQSSTSALKAQDAVPRAIVVAQNGCPNGRC